MRSDDISQRGFDAAIQRDSLGLCPALGADFTKREVVMLEFAKGILAGGRYDPDMPTQVLTRARSLTDKFFELLEKQQ